ncbi:MAG TPA: hypothetical protein VHF01_13185 [Candidatus Acidoferrum sp.]|nr:hypothetical protein [Candidatus Acidoferrum sp.]
MKLPEFKFSGIKLSEIKLTKEIVLIAVRVLLAIVALVVAVFLVIKAADWIKQARERRITKATDAVTPDRLIARCGPPAEEVTTDVFPVVRRTMRYKASGQRTAIFTFTRSADEPQNWVFLSMKDPVGDASYETPEAKIAALPCLDSTK